MERAPYADLTRSHVDWYDWAYMKRPTIREKLQAPAISSSYLRRTRLDQAWVERSDRRLLLLTAGAGYGKTSFLASQAREAADSFLWYSADESDTRLPSFAGALLDLLGVESPSQGGEGDPDDRVFSQRAVNAVVTSLRGRGRVFLVLDDLHVLQGCRPVLRFLENLIRYVPENATLVLSSREPLDIGAARARAEGRAAVIDARDLEFRADEIAGLYALRFGGEELGARQCRQILDATEGWAAGLEIFFQALDAPSPSAVDRALEKLLQIGSGWFDYFADEVVRKLDVPTREFLLQTSILPRLHPGVCDQLLGRTDSRDILAQLVERNLFTMCEIGREDAYRYHHLFHGYLTAALARRTDAGAMRELRRRAAAALLERGEVADAADLYAASGDADTTLRLIERHGSAMLDSRRYAALERALAVIPAARLSRSAEGLFLEARILDDRGRWDDAEGIYRRVLTLRPSAARRAEVEAVIGELLTRRGRHAEALTFCEKLLRTRSARDPRIVGRLCAVAGVAACEMGRWAEGGAHLARARGLYEKHRDIAGAARVDYLLSDNLFTPRGEFARAREASRRALASFRRLGDPRRICSSLTVLGNATSMAGDVREARDLAAEAWRLADSLALSQPGTLALIVLGRCALLDGDPKRARTYLDEAMQSADRTGESTGRLHARLLLAESFLRTHDRAVAASLATEAMAIARSMKDIHDLAQCRALLGWATEAEDPSAAGLQRRSAEREFRRLGATFDLHRMLLHRLAVEDLPRPQRRKMLVELLTGVARMQHDHLFDLVETEHAPKVLAMAVREGIEPGYATDLLSRLGGRAVPEVLPLATDASDAVRLRAVALLAQLGGSRARSALARMTKGEGERESTQRAAEEIARIPQQPLHIRSLGAFRVSVGEREIPTDRWKSGRARRLFQLLLIHRFRWVPGDLVLETLWPESDPEKSRVNLWQSVFQLRKILEPDLKELRASRYVRVEENGYRIEPGEGATCDLIEFEDALQKGDRLATSHRSRAAETHYRRALDLYQGEFLMETPYEELALQERERIRDLFVRASVRMAELYGFTRRWNDCIPVCRRGLQEDPYNEELQYQLVQSHAALGHRREALDAYQDFEARLAADLGSPLSPRMAALAEKVRAHGVTVRARGATRQAPTRPSR
jgi:LuxR family transcriptional regulator, maltose regulon positive regulatory protein